MSNQCVTFDLSQFYLIQLPGIISVPFLINALIWFGQRGSKKARYTVELTYLPLSSELCPSVSPVNSTEGTCLGRRRQFWRFLRLQIFWTSTIRTHTEQSILQGKLQKLERIYTSLTSCLNFACVLRPRSCKPLHVHTYSCNCSLWQYRPSWPSDGWRLSCYCLSLH